MAEPASVALQQRADWPVAWVQAALGHAVRDPGLFRRALTHRSAPGPSNERLEFLGDAVLNLLVAEQLYLRFPAADEGSLSRLRARLVSAAPLAEVGMALGIGEVLLLGGGELRTGGFRRESILADTTEALVGAVFLDAGLDAARLVVQRLFATRIAGLDAEAQLKDAKTRLQELLQAQGVPLPAYVLESVTGEPHEQTFHVRCLVDWPSRQRLQSGAQGSSRRRAEQAAAEALLAQLAPGHRPEAP